MIQFSNIDNKDIPATLNQILQGKKLVLSNYFGVGNDDECSVYLGDNTVLIRKTEYDFYRLFIQSADIAEAKKLLNNLNGERYVINIPSKKPIPEWYDLLESSGFENIGIYNRYYSTKVKLRKSASGDFATIEDSEAIDNLLKSNFSLYTDYLPTYKQLCEMIENNQVLVSRDEQGNVKGTLIYTIQGKKCYYNAWIDFSGKGLFLLYKAYNIAVEHGIQYVYFWVNSTNVNVINLHLMMGAQPDGLKDYTFIKYN